MYLSRELNVSSVDGDVEDELYVGACFVLRMTSYLFFVSLFDGTVPSHFYGELVKTEPGCSVLRDKGHFAEFAHFIRQHALESEDFKTVFKLKSVIWAVVSSLVLRLAKTVC